VLIEVVLRRENGQVTMEKQLLRRCRNRTTTILLNHDTGWVIGRALLLARAGAAIRKEVKLRRRDAKAAKQIVKKGPDLCGRLFYVAGVVPSDGGAKQLRQRGNAELFFRSSAISLNSFEAQIQIAGNF